jgi:hypothetical protein
MAKQVQVKISEIPDGWSEEAADFTNRVSFNFLLILPIIASTKKTSATYWPQGCSRSKGAPLA